MTWGRSGVGAETDHESLAPVEADAGSISDKMLLSVSQDFHHCCFSENLTLLLSQVHHMHGKVSLSMEVSAGNLLGLWRLSATGELGQPH